VRDAACPLSTFLSRSTYSAGVDGAYARRRWGHRGRDHCPRDQEGAPLLSPYQCPYRCCRHPVDFSRPLLTLPLLLPLPWRGVPGRRVSTRGPRAEPRGESRVLPRDQSRVLPRDHARRGRAWFRRPSTSRRRTPNATSTTRSRRAARHAPSPRPAGVRFWLQTARSAVGRARFRKRTLQHRTYTSDTCSPFMIVIKSVFRSGFVTPRGDHGRDR
jgi:hypothetical protein